MKSRQRRTMRRIEQAFRQVMVMVGATVITSGMTCALPASAETVGFQRLGITSSLHLSHPFGVAVDPHRHVLYVADSLNNRVLELSTSGTILHQWYGWGSSAFNQPGALAVGRGGSIYVIDFGNNEIDRFAADGRSLQRWGSSGTSPGQFAAPEGLTTDRSGNVYVADTLNLRIQKFSPTGQLLEAWTTLTSGESQFMAPMGIGVALDGNVYVSEIAAATDRFGNVIEAPDALHCVQQFTGTGSPIARWGTKGSRPGQFDGPQGIAIDSSGMVYVADFGNDRIQQFSMNGNFQRSMGPAVGHGLFLHGPAALALDGGGRIYVADWFNSRIDRLSTAGSVTGFWR